MIYFIKALIGCSFIYNLFCIMLWYFRKLFNSSYIPFVLFCNNVFEHNTTSLIVYKIFK